MIIKNFKYEEYLIKRYIKSANKLAFILKQKDDTLVLYQSLAELQLSHEQIDILAKYLRDTGEVALSRLR